MIEVAASQSPPALESLSRREREVLRLVSLGLCYKTIGERLFISARTVEGHVTKICQKLRVRNRAEAALVAHGGLHAQDRNPAQLLEGLRLLVEGLHTDDLAALQAIVEDAILQRGQPIPSSGKPPRGPRTRGRKLLARLPQ